MFIFLLQLANALPPGVVNFPITRRNSIHHRFAKRDSDVSIIDYSSLFTTTLKMGSDNQSVDVQIDTGSSDLWVMARSNPYCYNITNNITIVENAPSDGDQISCLSSGMFNPNTSDTFHSNSTDFAIQYGDLSFANGTFAQDTVSVGDLRIEEANFAVAYSSNSSFGVFGIGLPGLESTVTNFTSDGVFYPTYANLPLQMYQQGVIGSYGYSLWLNDLNAESGQLLFGGVDQTKYRGNLTTVPLISSGNGTVPNQLQIMLNGISIYQNNKGHRIVDCAMPALLDSGTTLTFLPEDFVDVIALSLNAAETDSGYVVPCNIEGGIRFNFSGSAVRVPFSELLFPTTVDGICVLGIEEGDQIILGDSFLRSAYVVYDLEHLEISFGNALYNVSSSSIVAMSSGVPGATKAPYYSNTDTSDEYQVGTATGLTIPTVSGGFSALQSAGDATGSATGVFGTATGTAVSSTTPTSTTSSTKSKNAGVNLNVAWWLLALVFLI